MPGCLLGIDIGTTATKFVVIDTSGGLLAEFSLPVALSSPHPGWAEEDPLQWWANVQQGIPALLSASGLTASDIAGVGVSGMVPALVLQDSSGNILRPSIQQNDARASAEITWLQSQVDPEDILQRTGSAVTQQSIAPKLRWLREHEEHVFHHIAHISGSYDFIVQQLTGTFSCERNWALESGLYDLRTRSWDERMLALAGIQSGLLGAVHDPADIVGVVSPAAAAACGLKPGTPAVAGSADHIASAFSAGVKDEGDLLIKLGGSGDILYCTAQPVTDPRMYLDYHLVPGKFIFNGCMASSGSLIRWFAQQFAPGEDYAALDQSAALVPPGADGLVLLPYFLGEKTPLNDPLARGTLIGLTLSHTRAHIFRAVLEGISFGFRHHLLVLAEHGFHPRSARLTNGGAHSTLWRQITADVLGISLESIAAHPGSSLGAAFVAGKGIGVFSSWGEIEQFITVSDLTAPNPHHTARYAQLFEVYLSTYRNLRSIYPHLAAF